MKSVLSLAALLAGLGCLGWAQAPPAQAPRGAQDTAAAPKAVTDREFVLLASAAGLAEVNLGGLAAKQASAADVKKFGQHMVDDHTKANKELLDIANRKKIPPAPQMDRAHQQVMDRLTALKGAEFDRVFMQQMVADHKVAVSLFEGESKNGQDADLKAYAAKTLPILKDHLKMAQELVDKDKGGKDKRDKDK